MRITPSLPMNFSKDRERFYTNMEVVRFLCLRSCVSVPPPLAVTAECLEEYFLHISRVCVHFSQQCVGANACNISVTAPDGSS